MCKSLHRNLVLFLLKVPHGSLDLFHPQCKRCIFGENFDCRCERNPSQQKHCILSCYNPPHSCSRAVRTKDKHDVWIPPNNVGIIFQTDLSQLWITASNKKGDLYETEEKKSLIWQQFGRYTMGPPLPFDPPLTGSTPTEISTGKWNNDLSPNFLIEASSCDMSLSAHANKVILMESHLEMELYHIIERITCLYKYTLRYPQHPLWNHQEKKCSSVGFAGRYAKKMIFFKFMSKSVSQDTRLFCFPPW